MSGSNYNPRNIQYIPAVINFAFLDLAQNRSFFKGLNISGIRNNRVKIPLSVPAVGGLFPEEEIVLMNQYPGRKCSGTLFFVIFSDLDGTLLDHHTYEWQAARPALNLCNRLKYPVVLVSSKTRAEMEILRDEMSISGPFVTENGGGVFIPPRPDVSPGSDATGGACPQEMKKLSLGLPYPRLVAALREIRKELGLNLKGFSDMKVNEISRLTGLDPDSARLAAMREYDEPFIILNEQPSDLAAVVQAAEKRGLTITTGGRFYHLQGGNDKGQAMDRVLSWYRQCHGNVASVALGDSPNDFPMLERADFPVFVGVPKDAAALTEKIPRLTVTPEQGPRGWNSAVQNILERYLNRPADG